MVSLQMLAWIHMRCREARPEKADLPFAGLNIILSGDFCQLPPVARRALYNSTSSAKPLEAHGYRLYRLFNRTIELDTVMHQQGDAQARFREALQRLRVGKPTVNDWAFLMKRCRASLPHRERTSFQDAVRLCGKRVEVSQINHDCLRDFSRPVIVICAKHDKEEWAEVKTEDGGNLSNEIPLCIGARIMLLHNIWTERGLVNGATGVVENILRAPSVQDCRLERPKAVLVSIDNYDGPSLYSTTDGRHVIPIFPITREFNLNKTVCSRVQFPLCLAWAITIHPTHQSHPYR